MNPVEVFHRPAAGQNGQAVVDTEKYVPAQEPPDRVLLLADRIRRKGQPDPQPLLGRDQIGLRPPVTALQGTSPMGSEALDEAPRTTTAFDASGKRRSEIEPLCQTGTISVPLTRPSTARHTDEDALLTPGGADSRRSSPCPYASARLRPPTRAKGKAGGSTRKVDRRTTR
ncbi:hypothetical protein ACIO3O_28785 [Streptomyces sp. NPDC087440]|uniref:hypothetical protein n=1 Tax=Streptomyces sp. NPDC087440 TaxID=3365790 RepID=UPI0038275E68